MHQIIIFTFVKHFLTFPSPVLNLLYPTAAVCILLLPGLYLFYSTELVLVLGTWALVVQAGEHLVVQAGEHLVVQARGHTQKCSF